MLFLTFEIVPKGFFKYARCLYYSSFLIDLGDYVAEITVHPSAFVSEEAKIGDGTRIWHNAQVREKAVIGTHCNIGKNVYIDFGVAIGDRVKIQNNVSVYHGVEIESDVFVGPSVVFTNDLYPRAFIWDESRVSRTLVKKGASLGANSTILCGIEIGEFAMVGIGSVVTKSVPAHALVHGCPAKIRGFVCECGAKAVESRAESGKITMACGKCDKSFEVDKNVFAEAKK